ncbi:pentatricopeptide repeat-containing protein At2g17210 [Aristolochia californica]|uniref:pentatricopeptide repeat-containing protein At2g17210 n=1 Tax=Aristolochia californica TaxID=171875 RepID=UPI0035D7AED4
MQIRAAPCNQHLLVEEFVSKLRWHEVLSQYHGLKRAGNVPVDPSFIPPILKACVKLQYFRQGTCFHAEVIKNGFGLYPSILNSTMDFYIKCGSLSSALIVFNHSAVRDSVSWNVMIHGFFGQLAYEEGLSLFKHARVAGFQPNVSTLVLVLQACRTLGDITEGLNIHSLIIRKGFSSVLSIQNSLLSLYVKSSNVETARTLFDEMTDRDVISWSVIIGGYAQSEKPEEAFRLFREICSTGVVSPDGVAIVSILQACSYTENKDQGMLIHGLVISRGFESDTFVGTMSLGIVSSLDLLTLMQRAGLEADAVTLVNLLQMCWSLGEAIWCKCIHSIIIRMGLEMNILVSNSLLHGYSKCEKVDFAWKLFQEIGQRNLISWSIMIKGLAQCGMPDEAMSLFIEMILSEEKPSSVTMLSLIEACSVSAVLERSSWTHAKVIKTGLLNDVAIGTAIVEMYGKCGDINSSQIVFEEMNEKNVVTWSAMITACGMNGRAQEAISLFKEMVSGGICPNKVTVLSVLSACSHGGLSEEGWSIFKEMIQDHGFEPDSEHYSCMVDMLGRAKKLEFVAELIKKMPKGLDPGASFWGALLSACRNYGNVELGQEAALHVLELEPSSSAGYLLASSMYSKEGMWAHVARMRRLVKEKHLRVVAGYSVVYIGHLACKFVATDQSHPQTFEIYKVIEDLHSCMKLEDTT